MNSPGGLTRAYNYSTPRLAVTIHCLVLRFLNEAPPEQLTAIYSEYFTKYGSVVHWSYLNSSHAWSAKVRMVLSKGFTVDLQVSVSQNTPYLIDGLLLSAATPQIKTLADLTAKFSKLTGHSGFLAAKLIVNGIEPIASWNPDSALALGSAFKLYVLAALLKEINEGKRHWNDVINFDSSLGSLPSGEMQNWPNRSPVTLATAATLMISISDNTAADLLIRTLGRKSIERMLRETGNTHAARDIPFLTTLEMFKLKSNNATLGKEYLKLSASAKENFLSRSVADYPRDSIHFGDGVMMIEQLEWFASPRDIANLLNYIREHSASGEGSFVRNILEVNPGLSIDKSKWPYVGYKGGSEPGVLNLSFLLEAKSGEWYVITGSWNDNQAALKDEEFEGYMQRATELVP